MTHKPMNLSHINLGQIPLVAKQYKKDAEVYATTHGYYLDDVRPAYNRFWRFWVIGQWTEPYRKIRFLQDDNSKVEIELKLSLY